MLIETLIRVFIRIEDDWDWHSLDWGIENECQILLEGIGINLQ